MTHGYAGTLDGICRIDDEILIYDLKTGKSVYSEVALAARRIQERRLHHQR
jgi:hypothetical protein